MKGYMSAREASYKWGVSESRVHKLCQQGRIPGLDRFGRSWVIPKDAEKPNRKWATDVTEFSLFGEKLYLSPHP